MNFVSLFAGVGGFDLAFERAGMDCVGQVEIDTKCREVLAEHWPKVPRWEDIHDVTADRILAASRPQGERVGHSDRPGSNVGRPSDHPGGVLDGGTIGRGNGAVDVLCGGFPCQDYSVAGKRGGLVGDRGALWWQFHRLIDECRPEWVVGENVPGLLSSSDGRDFGAIVGSLVELGYGVVWRVLDAQYFGVAQRRRRVFIVGHIGGQPRPEILAFAEGCAWDTPPRRSEGQTAASTLAGRTRGGGGLGTDTELDGALVVHATQDPIVERDMAHSLGANSYQAVAFQLRGREGGAMPEVEPDGIAGALRAGDGGSSRGRMVAFNPYRTMTQPGEYVEGFKPDPVHDALTANPAPKGPPLVVTPQVRRLTPLECERLQGFPDNWTAGQSDTQRYRQMGNAVAVPVVEWIGRNIAKAT